MSKYTEVIHKLSLEQKALLLTGDYSICETIGLPKVNMLSSNDFFVSNCFDLDSINKFVLELRGYCINENINCFHLEDNLNFYDKLNKKILDVFSLNLKELVFKDKEVFPFGRLSKEEIIAKVNNYNSVKGIPDEVLKATDEYIKEEDIDSFFESFFTHIDINNKLKEEYDLKNYQNAKKELLLNSAVLLKNDNLLPLSSSQKCRSINDNDDFSDIVLINLDDVEEEEIFALDKKLSLIILLTSKSNLTDDIKARATAIIYGSSDIALQLIYGQASFTGRLGVSRFGYPSGFGLSYLEVSYSDLIIKNNEAIFKVSNNSDYSGKEICFVYYIDNDTKKLLDYLIIDFSTNKEIEVKVPYIYGKHAVIAIDSLNYVLMQDDRLLNIKDSTYVQHLPSNHDESYFRFTTRVIINVFLILYFDAAFGYTAYKILLPGASSVHEPSKTMFSLIFLAVVAFITNLLLIVNLVKLFKNHKDAYVLQKGAFSDILDNLNCPNYKKRKKSIVNNVATTTLTEEANLKVASFEKLSLESTCNEFCTFFAKNGLIIDFNLARSFFSSLAASRLIFVKGENEGLCKKFIYIANMFFNTNSYLLKVSDKSTDINDLLWVKGSGAIFESNFLKGIFDAKSNNDKLHLLSFENVNVTDLNWFKDFMPYVKNPKIEHKVYAKNKAQNSNIYINLPQNLWFLMVASDLNMTKEIADNSFTLLVEGKACPLSPDEEYRSISYKQFLQSITEDDDEELTLTEEAFRKLDSLEEYVNSYISFNMGNKMCNQIEDYVLAFMVSKASMEEALDSVIATKIIPYISAFKTIKDLDGENSLEAFIDSILGVDNSNFCHKTIKGLWEEIK